MFVELVYKIGLRFITSLLVFAAISLIVSCDEEDRFRVNNTNSIVEEMFCIPLTVEYTQWLYLQGINGSIELVDTFLEDTFDVYEPLICLSGVKRVGSESVEDAQAHLADLSISVSEYWSEIVIRTSQPKWTEGRLYEIDYRINFWLRQQPMANVNVTNSTGNISVSSAETTKWALLTVFTNYGNVHLENFRGSHARVTLMGGNLSLNGTCTKVTCSITRGDVVSNAFGLLLNGFLVVDQLEGSQKLQFLPDISAELIANATNGVISISDLKLKNAVDSTGYLSGVLGDGDGLIQLTATDGNISIFTDQQGRKSSVWN
jgi:hypothetical protein